MWDESLIESNKKRQGRKRWVTVQVSVLIHAAVVAALIISSYWFVEAVPPPVVPSTGPYFIPAVLPGGGGGHADHHKEAPPPKEPEKVTQPDRVASMDEVVQHDEPVVDHEQNYQEPIEGTEGFVQEGAGNGDGLPGIGSGLGPGGGGSGIPPVDPDVPQALKLEMTPPVLIHKVDPEYPEIARRLHLQGTVVLEAVIARDGSVGQLQLLSSVHPLLDQAATKAVAQWRYRPASLKGKPVTVYFTVTVRFLLS